MGFRPEKNASKNATCSFEFFTLTHQCIRVSQNHKAAVCHSHHSATYNLALWSYILSVLIGDVFDAASP